MSEGDALVRVHDLAVRFETDAGSVTAVDGVSFELRAGEMLALVGESGAGKSAIAQTIMGLTRALGARVEGRVVVAGEDLLSASAQRLRALRGRQIALAFQDPASALNPVHRVGSQIAEQVRAHGGVVRDDARGRAVALLAEVGIPDAAACAQA